MSTQLTQADVARLLHEPSPLIRAEVAGKIAQEIDNPNLTDKELTLIHDIVRIMAKDVETQVRQALSYSLRYAAGLPHDVALKLANDIEIVALPVLEHSTVLTDSDLVEIIRGGSHSKQEAIAVRPNVSENVADELITSASEKAVTKLMSNVTARIADVSMNKAVTRFEGSDVVKEAMVMREKLPVTVAERLVTMVSEQLRDHLVSHHELSSAVASDIILRSSERAIINMSTGSSTLEIEKLVAQMYSKKRLTPSIVIRALCMGDIAFFESAVAIMANVPLLNARILLHDAGRLGLKTLYEKAGLPANLFPAVRMAMAVVHETELDGSPHGMERYRARVLERVLTQFEDFNEMSQDDLDYLLEKLSVVSTLSSDGSQTTIN
ncbi:MAG: DUF2336 domain-containing protein [Alphaproteobacteria bacterium]|nr:DUF2336 domain-containing protein [Alphaproteobacteria bacterium]